MLFMERINGIFFNKFAMIQGPGFESTVDSSKVLAACKKIDPVKEYVIMLYWKLLQESQKRFSEDYLIAMLTKVR